MSEVLVKDLHEFLQTTAAKQNLELSTDRDIWKVEAERMTSGYDAAQSELAALREELADRCEVIAMKGREVIEAQTAVTGWAAKCKAAEQRNAAMAALLRRSNPGYDQDFKVWWNERATILLDCTKPTESGASE